MFRPYGDRVNVEIETNQHSFASHTVTFCHGKLCGKKLSTCCPDKQLISYIQIEVEQALTDAAPYTESHLL